jgi:Cdc6-like AAA superfamily ATPase
MKKSKINERFVGRETEINSLIRSLTTQNNFHKTSGNISIISGETGIGKTELALILAQRLVEEFPDGQLIISLSNELKITTKISDILKTVIHNLDAFDQLPDDLN